MLLPLYFFHINKQQLCEAFTHSTLLLHLLFHKAFKQVSGLKPVQNLKKNCWGISPMESCMKSVLDSLCPQSSGIHLSPLYGTYLPWWALQLTAPTLRDSHVPGAHHFHCKVTKPHSDFFLPFFLFSPSVFLEIWLRFKRYEFSGGLKMRGNPCDHSISNHWFFGAHFHTGIISERTNNHINRLALALLKYALAPRVFNQPYFANGNQ